MLEYIMGLDLPPGADTEPEKWVGAQRKSGR